MSGGGQVDDVPRRWVLNPKLGRLAIPHEEDKWCVEHGCEPLVLASSIEALADKWDAKLRCEHDVGRAYSDWHSGELRGLIAPEGEDDEKFCPVCFAGMESSEHHEKCADPPPRLRYCKLCDFYTDHVSTAHDGLAARGLLLLRTPQ